VEVQQVHSNGSNFLPQKNDSGVNEWLTPFWVFLFNDNNPPPTTTTTNTSTKTNLNESIAKSIWFQRFDTIHDSVLTIELVEAINVSYVKIQREDFGMLSIAEVEIFSEKFNFLSKTYSKGSPIYPSFVMNPYLPIESFNQKFENVMINGLWNVNIFQNNRFFL
jgi:hypothetical protein